MGNSTGSWSSGTGTMPSFSQWIIGIGVPQYRWREMPQSFNRNCTVPSPTPRCSAAAIIVRCASADGSPEYSPESTSVP